MSVLEHVKIEAGEDLLLQSLRLKDAEKLFLLTDLNRAFLRNWLPWLDKTTRLEDTRNFIGTSLQQAEKGESLTLAILWKGKISGVIGLNTVDWGNKSTQIGYWVGEAYQGQGLVTRATRALTEYCFADLGLNRVVIRCAVDNVRSCAIPERLGYSYEGLIREGEWLYDHFHDLRSYAMLKADWKV